MVGFDLPALSNQSNKSTTHFVGKIAVNIPIQPGNKRMLFAHPQTTRDVHRLAITRAFLADETQVLELLLQLARVAPEQLQRIEHRARALVTNVRAHHRDTDAAQAFLREYDLSSQEGVVLMCLAEALLRIPDAQTADEFIQDKLSSGAWETHLGHSPSLLVNASTWGLLLTGKLVKIDQDRAPSAVDVLKSLLVRSGEPVIRAALKQAMRILAQQFVMGRTIDAALARSQSDNHRHYRHSFDMLGESALCTADARKYFEAYRQAITRIGTACAPGTDEFARPGISVKLSALHPRYEFAQRKRVLSELVPRLTELAGAARAAGICLTVDAEEADRLELSLDVFEAVFCDPALKGWNGLGLAVQAYQKRASHVIEWLASLARAQQRRIPVRLVKGAYWDSEIKRAQERGLDSYPVFTRKSSTDVSYLACARLLLAAPDAFYPQFATHNARTVASILELAQGQAFEFQRLHGMGEALYESVLTSPVGDPAMVCRVYAPVGSHEDLLPYLVRRLLENGANTSFVNRVEDAKVPVEDLISDPVAKTDTLEHKPHPRIPLPHDIFAPQRNNSRGVNLHDEAELAILAIALQQAVAHEASAAPVVDGKAASGNTRGIRSPADQRDVLGTVTEATADVARHAIEVAAHYAPHWDATPAQQRAAYLDRAAKLFEQQRAELLLLLVREAGKTVPDALSEIREAVDYCRYYAARARADFAQPLSMPGPTGERNELSLHGRGVFVCVSPWNFPLAIFVGQITAALAAGNAVLAKPARQTPLVAMCAVRLLHDAGIPPQALQFLPGAGRELGEVLLRDARVRGVAMTGSIETAAWMAQAIAQRPGPIIPLIAETGGQNVMLADSSALPEQVVLDALTSAFNSAGQRCSALRVLFVQQEIAPRVIELLCDALGELVIGDPQWLATDIGPVIDTAARDTLEHHVQNLAPNGRLLRQLELPTGTEHGSYFAPTLFEIARLDILQGEVFGPILHVVRYAANQLDSVIEAVNASGYGLTLGIHSRIDERVRHIANHAHVGNMYVNRNMIGAVVGVQPFGGEGLSGTGPKAGGPHYLHRFATERTLTVNTSAVGGNTALASLPE